MSDDYWKESVAEALCEAGLTATDAQITEIAKSMQISSEMRYECSAPVPNLYKAEMRQAEERATAREKALERQIEATEKLALEAAGCRTDRDRTVAVSYRDGVARMVRR